MENLIEVAQNYKNAESEPNGAPTSETGMSREEALDKLGLKDGCRKRTLKKHIVKRQTSGIQTINKIQILNLLKR